MADVDRVLRWFADGVLLRPGTGEPSTVDLALALGALSGAPVPRTEGADLIVRRIGDSDHLVFVLVDGLGLAVMAPLPERSFLRRHVALELRSVFPSATASALTSLATGLWPNRHGVPGWWTYLPERDLTVTTLPFIERWGGEPLHQHGVSAAELFPAATTLPLFRRDAVSFLPGTIADSVYSRWVRGATTTVPYDKLPAAIDAIIARVKGARGPTYSYLYLSTVDGLAHTFGPGSPELAEHLQALDAELARLADGLRGAARLALSADHGLIVVPPERKHVVRPTDALSKLLRTPPTGEPRAPLLHALPGQADRVRATFEETFGDRFALLSVDEAQELELFGPGALSTTARARIGDFVGIAPDRDVLLYRPAEKPTGTELLLGYHGGLLPDEVRIPLVVV